MKIKQLIYGLSILLIAVVVIPIMFFGFLYTNLGLYLCIKIHNPPLARTSVEGQMDAALPILKDRLINGDLQERMIASGCISVFANKPSTAGSMLRIALNDRAAAVRRRAIDTIPMLGDAKNDFINDLLIQYKAGDSELKSVVVNILYQFKYQDIRLLLEEIQATSRGNPELVKEIVALLDYLKSH